MKHNFAENLEMRLPLFLSMESGNNRKKVEN